VKLRITLLVAALSGFIALSYEILWYRAFSFVSWSHPTAFGLLLGAYLFGVALGAAFSRRFCRESPGAEALRPLAAFIFFADLVGFLVVPALGWLATWNWLPGLGLVAVSAGLMGAVLPLVAHYGIEPDDRAGANLSYVYLANIVGSATGSFVTGFVLMDAWSTRGISVFLALAGLAMVAFLVLASRPSPALRAGGAAAIVATAAACALSSASLFDGLYERLLFKQKASELPPLAHVLENRHGVIAVSQLARIYGGGAYDGAFNVSLVDDKNVIERAFAVSALHPRPKDVLMIGLSSGSWAQVVAHLPGVEHLTIIEINPGYLELIRLYPAVKSLLDNPKIDFVIDDGRRWLLRHPERKFDFIVMNTTYHWRAHATNLLSEEYLRTVREHLSPGGVHYFNTTSSAEAQRTAATVFPYAMRIINFIAVSDAPLEFDRDRWTYALTHVVIDGVPALDLNEPRQRDLLARLRALPDTLDEPYDYWGLERRDGILARTAGVPTITDDNMASENHPLLELLKYED